MSFAKFSNEYLMESFTLVDNLFINEYMPYADEKQIKAYIYGLYVSYDGQETSLEDFAAALDMEPDEIVGAFSFWEDNGLVQIICKQPFEVKYLSMKRAMQPAKKYSKEKYHDFNQELQLLFPQRMLTPAEYDEYYYTMETYKLQQDAMLMIVQYCINMKGPSVRYPYIMTVAKGWIAEGVLTAEAVEEKLSAYEQQDENMRAVMRAMNKKRAADFEEKQMLLKWRQSWGFDTECIVYAAKQNKCKDFKRLDDLLDQYYRLSLFSVREMQDFEKERADLRALAKDINRTIGVFYESLDHMIEHYVVPWKQKGFERDTLLTIAHYCFLRGIKSLEGVNSDVNRFFKLGLLTKESINGYIEQQMAVDSEIKRILDKVGLTRNVISQDRAYFRVWAQDWGFSMDVILHAASMAVSRPYPVSAINQILAGWRGRVHTLDEAKMQGTAPVSAPKEPAFTTRAYTAQELTQAFQDIYDFDDNGDI